MEPSPLTQQPRPEAFQPKVVRLYETLFKDDADEVERSDGFWTEFFLLRPDRPSLRQILDEIGPNDLLHLQLQTRQLFSRAVAALKNPHGVADLHALDTLSTFMVAVLAKKYTNPSSDIIEILAGLDHVDTIFTEFVGALESLIRNGRSNGHECCPNSIGHVGQEEPRSVGSRVGCTYTTDLQQRAVEVALAVTSGAYQTSLLTYFIQRDLFPAIINCIQSQIISSEPRITSPFMLLGLLANYNKFEFQNPYQMRLNDFVNERVIRGIVKGVGETCQRLRARYIDVQDDIPEGWTLAGTLNKIGLGAIAPGGKPPPKPVYDAETAKMMFAELPGQEAAVLLAAYDFTHANKLFSLELVTWTPEKGQEQPFASFISLTSYLLQHAHLSQRTTLYCHLNLMVFRLLIEDPILCKRMCSEESKVAVRLCRQRSPYLPLVRGERILATAVMDAMIDAINHNLRRRLDVGLYTLCVGILLRVISYMSRSRTRLQYHWAELFRSLLSLVRFLTTYAADLKGLPHIDTLLDHVVNLVALGLSAGETFLPTPAAYDDLFYKVVETGEVLVKFRATYGLANRASNSIDTLVNVSTHYKEMLADGGSGGNLTSLQVAEVIKQGYETLSIQAKEGLDSWEKYREADERMLLKKMARAAVADVRYMVAE
ncbi:Armadillo-like helical domain-containing protein [Madurella fahalii]|uniref:Armadillo-like helical domain-containing protein n=1 Tax=Madurella fahalii TaxID=1157608 RepID=A0ABQ0G4U2_9PEZI